MVANNGFYFTYPYARAIEVNAVVLQQGNRTAVLQSFIGSDGYGRAFAEAVFGNTVFAQQQLVVLGRSGFGSQQKNQYKKCDGKASLQQF